MSIHKESKEAGSKKKVTSPNETIASSKYLQGANAKENLGFDTLQVHAGNEKRPGNGPSAPAIYQSASFLFDDAQQGADIFAMKAEGNTYTRLSNPTTEILERRIAALEGGAAAVAVASGNASQFITFQQLCRPGDTIVSSKSLYGGTFNVFNETYHQLGIECTFVGKDPKEFKNAIKKSTKAVYAETIGNADFFVPDFEALGEICDKAGIPFVVDNTFGGGGYLFRPLEHGANISTDSLTKWIGGHGNSIGGIVVDGGNFDWGNGKFPQIAGPTPSAHGIDFWAKFGKKAFAARAKEIGIRDWGCCISPFNSFLILEGVETLSLRMQREMDNAIELARWLETLPQVESVSYPGLKQHPSHENALKYFKHGFGAVLTFVLKGTREQTAEFVNRLELITHLANVGDNRTLIIQPAGTTHAQLTADQLHAAGLSEGSLRLSVGIEDVEDIKDDIEAALKKF
jgi:OAH/OAS sulfhydrylase